MHRLYGKDEDGTIPATVNTAAAITTVAAAADLIHQAHLLFASFAYDSEQAGVLRSEDSNGVGWVQL